MGICICFELLRAIVQSHDIVDKNPDPKEEAVLQQDQQTIDGGVRVQRRQNFK